MAAPHALSDIEGKLRALRRRRREILALPPAKALEAILASREALPLVHSLPEQDFYFLVQDIGPEDALPLLKMATTRQWEFLLDREIWRGDRWVDEPLTRWLGLLLQADPQRVVDWVLAEKIEEVEFYLFRNIELRVREHDQDPSELGEGFETLDDVFYFRFREPPAGTEVSGHPKEDREAVITRLLALVAERDLKTCNRLLLEAASLIAAEVEEEAYRLRSVRLAENGFLPLEEAVGIYQPLNPEDLAGFRRKAPRSAPAEALHLPVPLYSAGLLGTDSLFERALGRIAAEGHGDRLQEEFAALCNRLIAADPTPVRQREELRAVVRKACGYLSIGLEQLVAPVLREDREADALAADVLQRHLLEPLFRVGFGQAARLKRRAQRWQRESWFGERELPLGFWGEEGLGLLGGLLLKRPLYFEGYRSGRLYRDFAAMAEIHETERELETLMWLDQLLSLLNPALPRGKRRFLTYKNLLLTLWAYEWLDLTAAENFAPLALADFRRFCESLFAPRTPGATEDRAPRRIPPERRTDFLDWLAAGSALRPDEISARLGSRLEALFSEIEQELGPVAPSDLDPRFIQLFRVAGAEEPS
ncbi:MAG: DUF6178 family protein [Desulfobacterales bacterium]